MTTTTAMLASSFVLGVLLAIPFAFMETVGFAAQMALFFSMGLLVAYSAIGLPAHLLLRWRGLRSLGSYAVAGATIGAVLSPISILLDSEIGQYQISVAQLARAAAGFATAGSLASSAFWLSFESLARLKRAR